MTLEERCAFLERELSEIGIQLDAAQKRLRLAVELADAVRLLRDEGKWSLIGRVWKALAAWDEVPGDELHGKWGEP
jgi:hypothetical protein